VAVRPRATVAVNGLPAMAGRYIGDGDDLCFVPRFSFLDGTTYTVLVGGLTVAALERRRPDGPAMAEVVAIHPTAAEVPRNLLRLYVHFSAPMSEGYAAGHVRLVDEAGTAMVGALLPSEYELWDQARRRLTVLLDPARIKRGLTGHRSSGYPLRPGAPFRLVVDDGFCDAQGRRLRVGAERRYDVGEDERRRVEPGDWTVTVPSSATSDPLVVAFSGPLDHGLLQRCLQVVDPDGRPVRGRPEAGPEDRSWQLVPQQRWGPGSYRLIVDPVLEDLAGNSVDRVFDRDLSRPADNPGDGQRVAVTFRLR